MPTEPQPPTLAQIVHRAVEVSDPGGVEEGVAQLLEQFEDRDEPVTSLADVETELVEAKGRLDPQDEDPALIMTTAVAVYLAHRRTEMDDERTDILRLAARAEFDGDPPPAVSDWLAEAGVTV
jgi:hypothetical protein